MRNTEYQMQRVVAVTEIVCDRCSKAFDAFSEEFEGVSIVKTFGYFSRHFGDMTTLNVDICETCLYEFVKTCKGARIE